MILFENLFKPRQLHLAVGMVTDFVSSIHNLKTVFLADFVSLIYNLKHCFEQPAANFLVCSLIFIEYDFSGCQFSLDKGRVGRGVVLPSPHT
ncbi:S1 RNA-binding domain-containing protein [Streptococcus pneumoniae]|nr:S1 RNA-binding domain-containing protein [Streptococcus pneumoniae]